MKTVLAVFTCASCSPTLLRHWPFFLRQEADENIVITTTDTLCLVPDDVEVIKIGIDQYLSADHLPSRLITALAELLQREWDILILCEYDTVIFNRIKVEEMQGKVAAHLAGHAPWPFYHNPWVFKRKYATDFVAEGYLVIREGICGYATPASSPDVFFGLVVQRLGWFVDTTLWKEFSRNSMDCSGDLERAAQSLREDTDVIHGIKHEHELAYLLHESYCCA